MKARIDGTSLVVNGTIVVTAQKTTRGFRWYSSIFMRNSRRDDYPNRIAAFRAGARTVGLTIEE